jgi:hypothetical protein
VTVDIDLPPSSADVKQKTSKQTLKTKYKAVFWHAITDSDFANATWMQTTLFYREPSLEPNLEQIFPSWMDTCYQINLEMASPTPPKGYTEWNVDVLC